MTAEELMNLGVPAQGNGSITIPQQGISPADLQAAGIAPMLAQSMPQNTSSGIDPAVLATMDDPNGFTSGPMPPPAPSAAQLGNPGSAGSDPSQSGTSVTFNPATNPYTPNGAANQGMGMNQQQVGQQAGRQTAQPQYSDFDKFMIQTGRVNIDLTPADRLQAHKAFDALMLKQLELQDPEKQLKLQQMQHEISTQGMKDQNLQAQTAESQSKVIAGELAKGKALQDASNQVSSLETQRDNLQAIADHPELKYVVGAARFLPAVTPGQRDLQARLAQVSGQNLISGINMLKDEASTPGSSLGFRITQQEAQAVKDAVNRLQTYQSPETFKNSVGEYVGILNKAIDAKKAQIDKMPSVNQDLLKQFSYSPSASVTGNQSAAPASVPAATAPVIKTIPGRGTFQSLGNGQWKQIQ